MYMIKYFYTTRRFPGAQDLPRAIFGDNALNEMRVLYGGSIRRSDFAGEHQKTLKVVGGNVIAFTQGQRPIITTVGFHNLEQPENAARWTALQAYRARGGVEFGCLNTEVPGVRAHQELTNRHQAAREAEKRDKAEFEASFWKFLFKTPALLSVSMRVA